MPEEMTGVVKEAPVAKALPPVGAANQLIVPALVVALSNVVPLPQTEPGVTEVMDGISVTVMTFFTVVTQPAPVVTV